MTRHDVPAHKCPHCNKLIDRATAVDGKPEPPEEDDITVCMGCASILMFNHDLSARLASIPELSEMILHTPEVFNIQAHVYNHIARKALH